MVSFYPDWKTKSFPILPNQEPGRNSDVTLILCIFGVVFLLKEDNPVN